MEDDTRPQACPGPFAQGPEPLEGLGLDGGGGAYRECHQLVAVVLQDDHLLGAGPEVGKTRPGPAPGSGLDRRCGANPFV
jgi:hypothetical protein